MAAQTPRQRRFMRAELRRQEAGVPTETGMRRGAIRAFAQTPPRVARARARRSGRR